MRETRPVKSSERFGYIKIKHVAILVTSKSAPEWAYMFQRLILENTTYANATAFLLSDEAEQISGSVLDVGTFANQGALGQPRS